MRKPFKSIAAPTLVAAAMLAATAGAPVPALAQCGPSVTVSPGDTLYRIAQRCGTSVSALLDANPGIDSPNTIYAGQRIRMPGTVAGPDPRARPPGIVIRLPGDRDGRRGRDGLITVTGIITGEGAECPAMRGRDGRLYTLAGDIDGFGPGDRVRVRGRLAEVSNCMQGTTINVRRIRRAAAG